MLAVLSRLEYLKQSSSWKQVASSTGIPYRRLLRLKNVGGGFTSEESKQIRNLYQRTSYAELRKVGFSPRESTRYSWYAPKTVTTQTVKLRDKISELAYGKTRDQFELYEKSITSKEFKDKFNEVYDAIRRGIEKSPESAETIYDY